jgi:hypothetical protein
MCINLYKKSFRFHDLLNCIFKSLTNAICNSSFNRGVCEMELIFSLLSEQNICARLLESKYSPNSRVDASLITVVSILNDSLKNVV